MTSKRDIIRRLDALEARPTYRPITQYQSLSITDPSEHLRQAYAEGKSDAEDWQPRKDRGPEVSSDIPIRWQNSYIHPLNRRISHFPVGMWAYNAGYDAGVAERDAREARRAAAIGGES